MGVEQVTAFLTHLAAERKVSASTQNQAKSALLFLYREVLGVELPWLDEVIAAKASKRLPVVLTQTEVRRLLDGTSGTMGLVISLLYGTGMRLLEGLRLRVKDVDFDRMKIIVRDGKGAKDRVTMLPESVAPDLQAHLKTRRALSREDAAKGKADVYWPDALARNYGPSPRPSPRTRGEGVSREWGWQYMC